MSQLDLARVKPWIGDPPRAEPPTVPGRVMIEHARVDMWQLTIAGVVLLPLWWFVFAVLAQVLSGADGLSIQIGLLDVVLAALIALVFVPVVHELVHGLAAQALGARPSYGIGPGYAYTTFREPLGRWAYLAIGLAPIVLISAVAMALTVPWPEARGWLVFACVVNAAGAIGDLWMSWRILRLPRDAIFFDLADGFAAFVPAPAVSPPPTAAPPAPAD